MSYTVKYRKLGRLFWRTLRRVKGDGYIEGYPIRWFILDDETRVEMSSSDHEVRFSKDRFLAIKRAAETETGQSLKIKE